MMLVNKPYLYVFCNVLCLIRIDDDDDFDEVPDEPLDDVEPDRVRSSFLL